MCGNDGVTYRNLCELQEVQFPPFFAVTALVFLFSPKNSDLHLLQATCRAGVQLAHSGKCTNLSTKPSCPTSCPEEGKVVPTAFQLFTAPSLKRWLCAAVTETAMQASVKCGDGRAVKGWRWPTTRTARPQSKLKKPTQIWIIAALAHMFCICIYFESFCCRQKERLMQNVRSTKIKQNYFYFDLAK